MAETVSSLIVALGRRIRDPLLEAHSSVDMITLLSRCQHIVNAATSAVKLTSSFSLPTPNPHNITSMTSGLPNHVRIERVLYNNEDLIQSDWRRWVYHDPYWIRRGASRPLQWSMIGRGLLAITPTVLDGIETVTVIGAKVTTALTTGGQATELPDGHMPSILALAEQLLLLRQRLLASVKPAVEHLDRVLPTGSP